VRCGFDLAGMCRVTALPRPSSHPQTDALSERCIYTRAIFLDDGDSKFEPVIRRRSINEGSCAVGDPHIAEQEPRQVLIALFGIDDSVISRVAAIDVCARAGS
jgi:hypothetical protein